MVDFDVNLKLNNPKFSLNCWNRLKIQFISFPTMYVTHICPKTHLGIFVLTCLKWTVRERLLVKVRKPTDRPVALGYSVVYCRKFPSLSSNSTMGSDTGQLVAVLLKNKQSPRGDVYVVASYCHEVVSSAKS